ncbi:hypothetical protein HK104_007721, partial [Borealophlyctis nickersoniae]
MPLIQGLVFLTYDSSCTYQAFTQFINKRGAEDGEEGTSVDSGGSGLSTPSKQYHRRGSAASVGHVPVVRPPMVISEPFRPGELPPPPPPFANSKRSVSTGREDTSSNGGFTSPTSPPQRPFRPISMVTHDDFYLEPRRAPAHALAYAGGRADKVLGPKPPQAPRDGPLRELVNTLDITRITNRVIAMGLCWRHRTEKKSHRNNVDDIARFLNMRYSNRYMIWNLAGDTTQGTYDTKPFNNQMVSFGLSKAYQMNMKTLFDICRSMHAWLSLDTRNVAVVQCTNGVGRTGVAISCYLRYADIFADANEAFDHFIARRTPTDSTWVTVGQRRYVQYFNNIMLLNGSLPNPHPLQLHRVMLNGIPNFDNQGGCNPGLEIYQSGKLVYSTVISNHRSRDGSPLVYRDAHHAVFRIPPDRALTLEKDIQIRVFHCPDPINNPTQVTTMISFSFHTGFIPGGLIRVASRDLEFARRDIDEGRFPPDFTVDFIFSDNDWAEEGYHRGRSQHQGAEIVYAKFLDKGLTRCLSRLVSYHYVRVDDGMMRSLEDMGCSKVLACFALQRNNNDYNAGYQYILTLSQSSETPSSIKRALSAFGRGWQQGRSLQPPASWMTSQDRWERDYYPGARKIGGGGGDGFYDDDRSDATSILSSRTGASGDDEVRGYGGGSSNFAQFAQSKGFGRRGSDDSSLHGGGSSTLPTRKGAIDAVGSPVGERSVSMDARGRVDNDLKVDTRKRPNAAGGGTGDRAAASMKRLQELLATPASTARSVSVVESPKTVAAAQSMDWPKPDTPDPNPGVPISGDRAAMIKRMESLLESSQSRRGSDASSVGMSGMGDTLDRRSGSSGRSDSPSASERSSASALRSAWSDEKSASSFGGRSGKTMEELLGQLDQLTVQAAEGTQMSKPAGINTAKFRHRRSSSEGAPSPWPTPPTSWEGILKSATEPESPKKPVWEAPEYVDGMPMPPRKPVGQEVPPLSLRTRGGEPGKSA